MGPGVHPGGALALFALRQVFSSRVGADAGQPHVDPSLVQQDAVPVRQDVQDERLHAAVQGLPDVHADQCQGIEEFNPEEFEYAREVVGAVSEEYAACERTDYIEPIDGIGGSGLGSLSSGLGAMTM